MIAEVAVALVLVIGAGLMVKSLLKLQAERTGFRSDGLMTFELNLPNARYQTPTAIAFYQRALDEIRAVPGVQSVGAINYLPLANFGFNGGFRIEGRPPFPADTAPVVEYRAVTPGYFGTMGIPLVRGQDFTAQDTATARPVVIINQAMADRYWPNQNPVGARILLTFDSGNETDVVVYIECRPMAELDNATLFLVIRMVGVTDSYADQLPLWQDILDSIQFFDPSA